MKLRFLFTTFLFIASHALADISFITGTWTGTGTGKQGTFCLRAQLKATAPNSLSGIITESDLCDSAVTDHCNIQGNVNGSDITFNASNCLNPKTDSCVTSGQFNSTFSTMNLTAICPLDNKAPYTLVL